MSSAMKLIQQTLQSTTEYSGAPLCANQHNIMPVTAKICNQMSVASTDNIVCEFLDNIEGAAKYARIYQVYLESSAQSVTHYPCKYPIITRKQVRTELD